MAYLNELFEIGQVVEPAEPIAQPLTFKQFAALDYDQLWKLFEEQRARIQHFEEEDRRKARYIDRLLDVINKLEERLKGLR